MVVIAIAVVGYLYAGLFVYDQLSVTHAKCNGRFPTNTPAAFTVESVDTTPYAMPAFETVTFPSRDPEVSISAWFVPPDDEERVRFGGGHRPWPHFLQA